MYWEMLHNVVVKILKCENHNNYLLSEENCILFSYLAREGATYSISFIYCVLWFNYYLTFDAK